ncbi:MAG TPA: hypothetical protein VM145_01315 [Sphingomicrobium sp.]|nr:hypothetical protein [Sphingomicrobium sp.]
MGLLSMLLGILAGQPAAVQQSVTRMIVQDELILRIPVQPHAVMPQIDWVEHKGPKCIPTTAIRNALLSGSEEVDFVLANRVRVRAKFGDGCPALDFYGGFYLQPHDDMQLCARRDSIHSRMGGSCTIERFKLLQPRIRRD